MSFGTILAMLCLEIASASERSSKKNIALLMMLPIAALSYSFTVVAYSIAAAAAAQKSFEQALAVRIITDIEAYPASSQLKSLAVIGYAPVSPVLVNTARKFPVVSRVVDNPVNGDLIWGHALFSYNGLRLDGIDASVVRAQLVGGKRPSALIRLKYSLYFIGQNVVLVFPPSEFP